MSETVSSSFSLLDNRVQKWVWKQNWSSLRDIQENSIPFILRGNCDVIISASTAGGKTEAAFLPIITQILKNKRNGYQVLYISPLKALINDQYRRLKDMVSDMPIDIIPWHGDVDASRKQKSLKSPNGIIIITPESLESFFVNRKQHLANAFSNLLYVVIDELHSFIGTERGKQLQSLLSRIQLLSRRAIPHIALSATFSDYETVKKYLREDQAIPCIIPPTGVSNHEIRILIKEFIDDHENSPDLLIAEDIYNKLRGDNNLIFANSRVDVEKYATILGELCDKNFVRNEFRVHHGNLSKSEREIVESDLQRGDFPISAVCTSTLELGVDIGKVKSIVQIGKAYSVSGLRQRLGRSGRRGEASILKVYSIDYEHDSIIFNLRASLVQNIAVIELLKEKCYESISSSSYHFSTLIQQVLSLICQYGGFQPKDGWNYLCKSGAFRNITPELFMELLKALGEKEIVAQTHSGEIVIGIEGEKIVKSKTFYVAFQTTIDYTIIDNVKHKAIGTLQYLTEVGDFVILGGRKWNVVSIDEKVKKIYVIPVKHGKLPLFFSKPVDIDGMVVCKMREIYISNEHIPYIDAAGKENLDRCRSFFKSNNLEEVKYFTYGNNSFLMTWAGDKINRTIALMLSLTDGIQRDFDHISIGGTLFDNIQKLRELTKPESADLAALIINRKSKEMQKYDYLLPEKLLNMEYGNRYLDADGAWQYILGL